MRREKKNSRITADQMIHEGLMREGERLEELLGPVTYEDPEGFDEDAAFQKLLRDRAALHGAKDASVHRDDKKNHMERPRRVRRSYGTLAKAAVFVLVAGACLIGFSLQSEATRMWWMESFGWDLGGDSATKVNNDKERELSEAPEWEAEAVIEKELGIQVPKLFYKPEWLVYSDYMYETVTNKAIMYYKTNDGYLTINMMMGMKDTSSSASFDSSILSEFEVESCFGKVVIKELQSDGTDKNTVLAEWDYQDVHYEIFGRISQEELKCIVENLTL